MTTDQLIAKIALLQAHVGELNALKARYEALYETNELHRAAYLDSINTIKRLRESHRSLRDQLTKIADIAGGYGDDLLGVIDIRETAYYAIEIIDGHDEVAINDDTED